MLTRLTYALSAAAKAVAALACALLAVLITVVVFQRFVTHSTPRWAEELPRMVLVWLAFVGGIVCTRERGHLMAGILPYLVKSPKVQRLMDRFNQAVVALALLVLTYAGWKLAMITREQMLTALDISAAAVYIALPLGCALSALVHIVQIFEPWPPRQSDLHTMQD